jgi:hypothetical protein
MLDAYDPDSGADPADDTGDVEYYSTIAVSCRASARFAIPIGPEERTGRVWGRGEV